MKTEENNFLIAEFMGLFEKYPTGSLFVNGGWWAPHEFKYNTSWDWLMPVVEKIEEKADTILECNDALSRETAKYQFAIPLADISVASNYKLECVYKAVVEFIKWYNNERI